jgi:hypothetical protein
MTAFKKEVMDKVQHFLNLGIKMGQAGNIIPMTFAVTDKEFIERVQDVKYTDGLIRHWQQMILITLHIRMYYLRSYGIKDMTRFRRLIEPPSIFNELLSCLSANNFL